MVEQKKYCTCLSDGFLGGYTFIERGSMNAQEFRTIAIGAPSTSTFHQGILATERG
jgi:hypothetical protein